MGFIHWLCPLLLAGRAQAAVDENGKWFAGVDISELAPKPAEMDQAAADQLSRQPPEKLFQLLAFELSKEDRRPEHKYFRVHEFQDVMELNCYERLLYILKLTNEASDEIREYHLNITGTSGLYWMLRQYPDENSWVWLLTTSHEFLIRRVNIYISKIATIALDNKPCLTNDFRVVLMDAISRWKRIYSDFTALLWNGMAFGLYGDVTSWNEGNESGAADASGPPTTTWSENLIFGNMWASGLQRWFEQHNEILTQAVAMELRRGQELASLQQEAATRRSHHQESGGMFKSFEYLRRITFNQWALDKGLLRALLRHVWKPAYDDAEPVTVGDFGAGGGQYSRWLNESGLVTGFAFDGTPRCAEISGGKVQEVNLVEPLQLWRTFDWALSLEVAEHIPKQHAAALLANLKRHSRQGLIMSWSDDWEGIGHVNCLLREEFIATVERETGYKLDLAATELVKRSCEIDYIARTIAVFRAPTA